MEGLTGIEPASLVWKTKALPLSYSPEIGGTTPEFEYSVVGALCEENLRERRRTLYPNWGVIFDVPRR